MAQGSEGGIDSIVTDPPYGLEFMGKEWDGADGFRRSLNPNDSGRDNPFGRASRTSPEYRGGPLFQEFSEAWGREAIRTLKPGGHLLAFGGSRTFHRLISGLEDAGFEIRDCLMWLYGQGMPKGKSVLKPSYEPIVLARKPLAGTLKRNVEVHGTGALNIDGCRIAFASEADEIESKTKNRHGDFGTQHGGNAVYGDFSMLGTRDNYDPPGRWPANVILDPYAAAALDLQSGESTSRKGKPRSSAQPGDGRTATHTGAEYDDRGGASRFFYVAKANAKERAAGLDGKNPHPTVKPVLLMRWLTRLVTPPGGVVLDPFMGSGTTGISCLHEGFSFVGIDLSPEYVEVSRKRIAHWRTELGLLVDPEVVDFRSPVEATA